MATRAHACLLAHTLTHTHTYALCGDTFRISAKGTGKNAHLLDSICKGLNYILSQMLPKSLTSYQPSPRCWLQSSPLRQWQVLAHPKGLGATKNKASSLNNHKNFRDSEALGPDSPPWLTRFISYTRSICQDWERMKGATQRVKENKKAREYVPDKRTR